MARTRSGAPDRRIVGLLLTALAAGLLAAPVALGAEIAPPAPSYPHAPGVLLVGFAPGAPAADRAAARAAVGATRARPLSPLSPDAERWELPARAELGRALAALAARPGVRYAEPDYLLRAADVSDDPIFLSGELWGMYGPATSPASPYGSNAAAAWEATTGSSQVYIGIVDEGVQYSHPDLTANMWVNAAERDGRPGVDDDGNGYVDDVRGWDHFNHDASVFDGDELAGWDSHGTHVAGTIGALGGNGTGVAGVAWQVTMIPSKFLGPGGGYLSDAVSAIDYLTDLKLRKGINLVATSNSWGGGPYTQSLLDAIERGGDAGILFVAAAGNSSSDNDALANYPSNYECTRAGTRGFDCVVAVAALDASGALAYFSSYGASSVDLGAPGMAISSTYPIDGYSALSGTSMATPHVSGAVALCAAANPTMGAAAIRDTLMRSASATASLAGKTATGGRLDAAALVAACRPALAPPSGTISNLSAAAAGANALSLSWSDTISGETAFEISRAPRTSGVCGAFSPVGTAPAGGSSYLVSGLAPSSEHCLRIRGTNNYAGGSATAWSNTAVGRTDAPPPGYVCAASAYAWVDPSGGTVMTMSDDSYAYITLPWSVTAWGLTSDQATISSNGFMRLGQAAGSFPSNAAIPSSPEPNGVYAAAWDDWNPTAGGTISRQTTGSAPHRRFVVSWVGVPLYARAGSESSFQLVLEEGSNAVTFAYADMNTGDAALDAGASATAGVESLDGQWGAQISYETKSLPTGSAYRCTIAGAVAPVAVDTAVLPDATAGAAYRATLTATGGSAPYTWSLTSGALPAGLTLSSAGLISGTPSSAGTSAFVVKVAASDGSNASASLSIAVAAAPEPPAIAAATLPDGVVGRAYSTTLAASGGVAPYTWSLSAGSLPAGLSLSSAGTISGTPSVAGTSSATVRASGANGGSSTATVTIRVGALLAVTSASLVSGTAGSAYSTSLGATGGLGAYTWSLASGSLPAGLSLSSAGTISGTPTQAGSFAITVTVRDAASPAQSASRALTLTIAFGKASPSTNTRFANTTTSVTLTWYAHTGATNYRSCLTSAKTCSSWLETSGLSRSVAVARNTSYIWQVQAWVNGAWIAANGGTAWKFSIAK